MNKDKDPPIKLGVLGIFKNESMGIREWIEHYKWQGVDVIVLLDNNSTDAWRESIEGLEKHIIVLPAPENYKQRENYVSLGIPRLKEEGVNVMAILDLDEFMFGKDGKNMKEHVQEIFGQPNRPSQISCNWIMFGSSGHKKQPPSIRQGFVHKKASPHVNIKSIVWIDDIQPYTGILPIRGRKHGFYKGVNQHICNVKGRTEQCPQGLQLNHYKVQSEEYFNKVKLRLKTGNISVRKSVYTKNDYKKADYKEETDLSLANLLRGGRRTTRKKARGGAQPNILVFMSDNRRLKNDIESSGYNSLAAAINKEYCKKHNYAFIYYRPYLNDKNIEEINNCVDPSTRKPRHAAWSKLLSAQMALEKNYEYVIFIDSDCIFKDFDTSIQEFLGKHMNNEMTFLNNKPYSATKVCSGFFVCKNSPKVKEFIREWFNYHKPGDNTKRPYEQFAIHKMLYEDAHPFSSNIGMIDSMFLREENNQFMRHVCSKEKNMRRPYFKEFIRKRGIDFNKNISSIDYVEYDTAPLQK
jgi:hypothetical protein